MRTLVTGGSSSTQVFRWTGQGTPVYHRMSADGKHDVDAEFARHGRRRYL